MRVDTEAERKAVEIMLEMVGRDREFSVQSLSERYLEIANTLQLRFDRAQGARSQLGKWLSDARTDVWTVGDRKVKLLQITPATIHGAGVYMYTPVG